MVRKFFGDWLAEATGARSSRQEPLHPGWFANHRSNPDGTTADIYAQLRAFEANVVPGQMLLGAVENLLYWTQRDTHTLIVGPSRSAKTAGLIIPLVLAHPGPVVTTSTKIDTAIATAMSRGRFGRVWHFSPSEPCPPGFTELRWSPITAAKNWDLALDTGRRMASAAYMNAKQTQVNGEHQHFQQRAGLLLACVLHYAAITGKDMAWVVRVISSGDNPALLSAAKDLVNSNEQVAGYLLGLATTPDRERGSYFTTASNALGAYLLTDGMNSARDPNFDIDAFVSSGSDTIYITTPPGAGVAPLVVGLLGEIRRAVYANHRKQLLAGNANHPVTHFVLDELATIAPLPDLDSMLAVGGEGLIVSGAIQDLSQARARWGDLADGFFTLWQNVLAVRGIRDQRTLELLSLLSGDFDRRIMTTNVSQDARGDQTTSWNESWTRQRRLPPDQILQGNPNDPDAALMQEAGGGIKWVKLLPYYRAEPWLTMLMVNAGFVVNGGREPWARALPLPDLDRQTTAYIDAQGPEVARFWRDLRTNHRRLMP